MGDRDKVTLDELKIIDKKTLHTLIPYSPVQVWRMERAGRFPARISLGPNRVGYRFSEVKAWIAARPAAPLPARRAQARSK